MNKIVWVALVAMTLSACGTTSDKHATVEDRTGGKPAATAATAGQATGETQTAGMGATGVTGSSIDTALTGDPRKNPANPLSKRSVFFDYDSFVVKDEYRSMLEAHATYLASKRDSRVILQGNADERGSREYNLALGQKRAESVRKALAVLGVSDAQLESVSFGEEKPRNEADTEAAYAENRRTDVVYSDE